MIYEDAASAPVAHPNIAEHGAARAEQHVLADFWMSIPMILARAAQRHAVE